MLCIFACNESLIKDHCAAECPQRKRKHNLGPIGERTRYDRARLDSSPIPPSSNVNKRGTLTVRPAAFDVEVVAGEALVVDGFGDVSELSNTKPHSLVSMAYPLHEQIR
jgi:hypothetical protein